MEHKYECLKHKWPEPGHAGIEWRCPSCAVANVIKRNGKRLTTKQKQRLGATSAPRIDDLSGHAWGKIRNRIKQRDQYTCRACKRADLRGVVDHIKPLEQGGTNDDTNLQYLCEPCHVDKTNRDRGFKVKRAFGPDGMPIDGSW
ncbi:HNH endonuclease [Paraburkholderia heleia]|uniref:HNH endonuclease n=1 Tax=Paraburkholderia heleia TaxID=634127 RepID=UPI0009FEAEDB